MKINAIVAVDLDNGIGFEGGLPWQSIREDLKYFKSVTWGNVVVMGMKTFESLYFTPLPGRYNVVVTKNIPALPPKENLVFFTNLPDMLSYLLSIVHPNALDAEVFVIGGQEIFEALLPLTTKVYMTRVHGHFECDRFFPKLPTSEWEWQGVHKQTKTYPMGIPVTFETYVRRAITNI